MKDEKPIILKEGEKLETVGYKTWVSTSEYISWMRKLVDQRESLPPEIIGLLLGRAEPVRVIKKKEEK